MMRTHIQILDSIEEVNGIQGPGLCVSQSSKNQSHSSQSLNFLFPLSKGSYLKRLSYRPCQADSFILKTMPLAKESS